MDYTDTIDDTLYQYWRHNHPLPLGDKETVAYDLTSVLFFGVTCPLAELGHNTKKIKRRQVNLALLVSKWDKYPISHFVYNGSRNISSTVKNLIVRLIDTGVEAGTIIWDRGNVSKDHVKAVEATGWKLICGLPKTSKGVWDIINKTDVRPSPNTLVHKSKSDHIYAVKTRGQLYGRERPVIVYMNQDQRNRKINAQNDALAEIGEELDALAEEGKDWSEAELHKKIDKIIDSYEDYVKATVKRKGDGSRIKWKYLTKNISNSERSYGKYLLLSTDESLSAKEVVKAYFEKDFVEKVFRTLKTDEKLEPVRHRLEPRVRAYMFVCVLAYRLLSVLHFKFEEVIGKDGAWERTYDLLHNLKRVERTEVVFGKEMKTWYLNVTKNINDTLRSIGMKNLLKEETKLNL